MNLQFTPTDTEAHLKVPFFEDARSDYAPYYSVNRWTASRAKSAVTAEIGKLGGAVTAIREGYFGEAPRRYGYIVEFTLNGAAGRITVAGLPIKSITATKQEKVRIQALLNVRDWLKAAVTSMIFSPGNHPLIPHLLGPGDKTMAEFIAERAEIASNLPRLLGDIIEGEIEDDRSGTS